MLSLFNCLISPQPVELTPKEAVKRHRHNCEHSAWAGIPIDILHEVGKYLDARDLGALRQTCNYMKIRVDKDCSIELRRMMAGVVTRAMVYRLSPSMDFDTLRDCAIKSAKALRNRHRTAERDALRAKVDSHRQTPEEVRDGYVTSAITSTAIVGTVHPFVYGLSVAQLSGVEFPTQADYLAKLETYNYS